ncbi:MAG: helix-turn-helix domain-containing protein [Actinomycetota bacterium]
MAEPHEVPQGHSGEDGDWAAGVARVVGDRWSILAIRAIFRGIRRFDDLQADLGISRGVLTDRLRRLMDAGVVERVPYQENPVRYDYRLTPKGLELSPMIVALLRWGSKWVGGTQHGPVLIHKQCGTELEQGFWCRTCRTTFGPLGVGARHE